MGQSSFWDDQEKARETIDEANIHKEWVQSWKELDSGLSDLGELYELAQEEEDTETLSEVERELGDLEKALEDLELRHMLGEKEDRLNAILTIHPGAGGTESADWAQMLVRMYLRWAERRGFQTETLDLIPNEAAGIKSATIEVKGGFAYGYLKSESGVHRLVRISPFDSNNRRHTSFASVFVYPEAEGDITVDVRQEDLRIDTYRSGGAGGQHVNKTDSAVRITHIPTGIVVQCQNERSQHKNRASARKMLAAKLYQHEQAKRDAELAKLYGQKGEIAFGNQIRSYVLYPYQLVRDERSELKSPHTDKVLDGDIQEFVDAYLRHRAGKNISVPAGDTTE
jgi:peptide chain release factor 2